MGMGAQGCPPPGTLGRGGPCKDEPLEDGGELCAGEPKGAKPCTEASQHPFGAKQGRDSVRHEFKRERASSTPNTRPTALEAHLAADPLPSPATLPAASAKPWPQPAWECYIYYFYGF